MKNLSLVILAAVIGVFPVAIAARRTAEAGRAADITKAQFDRVSADARECVDLQSTDDDAFLQVQSTADAAVGGLVNRVSDALTEAGLAISTLASLAPESEVIGEAIKRQAARLTLERLTLRQLGRFLEVWRQRQPRWIVSSIQLTSWPPSAAVTTYGDQPPSASDTLRASIVIETLVASATGETP